MSRTVVKASSPADLLAALPRLTGFAATESAYLIFFENNRTRATARFDLPTAENVVPWLAQIISLTSATTAVALIISTEQPLTETPACSMAGEILTTFKEIAARLGITTLDLIASGSDGYASFQFTYNPTLESSDAIATSALNDPNHEAKTLDQWREENPALSSDDPNRIAELAAEANRQATAAG